MNHRFVFILMVMALVLTVGSTNAQESENVELVGSYDTPGDAFDVFVAGNLAYVAQRWSGLSVIDVSDPENPDEIVFYDMPGWTNCVFVAGDLAYVANHGRGLRVINVSDPAYPYEVGFCNTRGAARSVFVVGCLAYVANDNRGLCVIDVSEPRYPVEVGFYDTPYYAYDVFVVGELAYVADNHDGLRVIDVSEPDHPDEVGFYDTPGMAWGVFVVGDLAYVADGRYGGLRVIDVSDPENPDEIGFCETPWRAIQVIVSGDLAYVTNGNRGLRIIDVSDPRDPVEVGFYDMPGPGWTRGVFVSEGLIYVAEMFSDTNLGIYRFTGAPVIVVEPDVLDFGEVEFRRSAELTLTISNIGNADLTVSDISAAGDYFSVDFAAEFILGPDDSQVIDVTFTPNERGELSGLVTITSDDPDYPEVTVDLVGVSVWVSPQDLLRRLIVQVADLVTAETINPGQGNALTVKLEHAIGRLDREQIILP